MTKIYLILKIVFFGGFLLFPTFNTVNNINFTIDREKIALKNFDFIEKNNSDPNYTYYKLTSYNLAHSITNGSKEIIVAIIDTGIDYRFPELSNSLWQNPGEIPNNYIDDDENGYVDDIMGWNFIDNSNDPWDGYGHGTFISSQIIGMKESVSNVILEGLAPNISLMPLKWFDNNNNPPLVSAEDKFVAAIQYAVNKGANIISLSMFWRGLPFNVITALEWAYSKGVLIVGVTGNNAKYLPYQVDDLGALNQVIATGAVNKNLTKSSFSQYGQEIEIVAPGEQIYGAWVLGKAQNASLTINNSRYQVETFEYSNYTQNLLSTDLIYAGIGSDENFSLIDPVGKIVLIDRGSFTFKEKVENASIHGALGVIMANNQESWCPLQCTLDSVSRIPVLGIAKDEGETLKTILANNLSLNVEMSIFPTNITVKDGTSFAVPYISAGAALLLSLNPELSNNEIRTILTRTATDLNESDWDIFTGFGLLNISFALESLADISNPSISLNSEITISEDLRVLIDSDDDTSIFSIEVAMFSQNEELKYYQFHYQGYKHSQVHVEIVVTDKISYPLTIQVSSEDVTGKKDIIEEIIFKTDSGLTTLPNQSNSQTPSFNIIWMPIMIGIFLFFKKLKNKSI